MKLNRRISCIVSIAIMVSCALVSPWMNVRANFIMGKKLMADMSNLTCYYSSEIASVYGVRTMRGATSWNSIFNPALLFDLNWTYTNDRSQATAVVDTYSGNSAVNAYTLAFDKPNLILAVDQSERNWDVCYVYINTQGNADHATMAHEFGHVLGLDENNGNPSSIMSQEKDGRTATAPSMVDLIAINRLYLDMLE